MPCRRDLVIDVVVASNLFGVIWALQQFNGLRLEVGFEAVGNDVVSAVHAGRSRRSD